MKKLLAGAAVVCLASWAAAAAEPSIEQGFQSPPSEAKTRVWWWWLNGNVDKAVISRDLAEMKKRGIGGVNIIDAGGATQGGHQPVPAGPRFGSPAWQELFKHALAEAEKNGIEIGLNIQSGWNLGGPDVTPDEACKYAAWSETVVEGGKAVDVDLPKPAKLTENYFRDVCVLAWPAKAGAAAAAPEIRSSSVQKDADVGRAADGNPGTFWVSDSGFEGGRKQWLELSYPSPVTVRGTKVQPRPGYGPKTCELAAAGADGAWKKIVTFDMGREAGHAVAFEAVTASKFRLLMSYGYDPKQPDNPRNVQVAEWTLDGAPGPGGRRAPIRDLADKTAAREVGFSSPKTEHLLDDGPGTPGEEDANPGDIVDLTEKAKDGKLSWQAPAGRWTVLRFGYTVAPGAHVSTSSDTWKGLCVDYLNEDSIRAYWKRNIAPMVALAGAHAGKTWKYVHTDSWELGGVNWTPRMPEEFRTRRGYDIRPWLPVVAGKIVRDRASSNRFLNDFRRTVGDCIVDRHYKAMADLAAAHGMGIHPESGGPHGAPVDGLQAIGRSAIPMMEFWARSKTHRVRDEDRHFVKQGSSAAHTYGKRINMAEGFTTIGPHWEETLWDNLKPSFDYAYCEGLNRLMWHAFTCTPDSMGIPGQQYFAGTHLDPNCTWWRYSESFFDYLNRLQFVAQQGLFRADVLYYYGDWVPNFVRLKKDDPAKVLPGYDYDVCNEEVLLTRVSVANGRIALPDGMSYRLLALPDRPNVSPAAMRRIAELVKAGATVVGRPPTRATGLTADPASADAAIRQAASDLWGADGVERYAARDAGKGEPPPAGERRAGMGRVVWGRTAREVLEKDGVPPDVEVEASARGLRFEWMHRGDADRELYFVSNQDGTGVETRVSFRVTGIRPELWDPVTGRIRALPQFSTAAGRTVLPLRFEPFGQALVVFRRKETGDRRQEAGEGGRATPDKVNFHSYSNVTELVGGWGVTFDPKWGGPAGTVTFDRLVDWTTRPEEGIKFYSGTAVYRKTFDFTAPPAGGSRWLSLGAVRELARVRLNGKDLGVLWCPPWRVDVTPLLKEKGNELEIEVVNFWPNRLIGDAAKPAEKRLTKTNIMKFKPGMPLVPSGLTGPVTIQAER